MRRIERLRADHPMWGKRKLAVLLRREGIDVSVDGRAHPDEAHGERRRHARADASSQTRSTPLAHHGRPR